VRFLILSDIHGNKHALDAVLAAAEGQYEQVVCLGDIVGYGAHPNEVTGWVKGNVSTVIRGNHDRACCGDEALEWFNLPAQQAALWTLAQLSEEHLRYLQELAAGPVAVANFWAVHGSPADEDEYITEKADAQVAARYMPGDICFFGHTHYQGGFGVRRGRVWELDRPKGGDSERCYQLENDTSYLLNPGSVGQPRDHDPRAAYALFDSTTKTVMLRRAGYPVEAAQQAIRAAGLPAWLADRLRAGR